MNNQLSYCGLVDAKLRASDKDLPVQEKFLYSKIRFFSSKQEILNVLIFDASLAWLL